jgi:DNA-directed RNA polymerase subunit M/transcription elongation factor TFIIS
MSGNIEYLTCHNCGGVLVADTDNADGVDTWSCNRCGYYEEVVTPQSDQYEATKASWALEAWYNEMSDYLDEEGKDPRTL